MTGQEFLQVAKEWVFETGNPVTIQVSYLKFTVERLLDNNLRPLKTAVKMNDKYLPGETADNIYLAALGELEVTE
jgi:hypothetical protein